MAKKTQASIGYGVILNELNQLHFFKGKVTDASPVVGGLNNDVYKVNINGKLWLAKKFASFDLAKLDAHCQQKVASYGLAPKIITQEQCWLISEFIEGKLLESVNTSIEQKLARTITLAAKLHQIRTPSISCQPLKIKSVITKLLLAVDDSSAEYQSYSSLIDSVLEQVNQVSQSNSDLTFIHGDLNFTNIIASKHGDLLIDFESASLAPIEYELGMMCAVNCISSKLYSFIVEKYMSLAKNSNAINTKKVTRYALVAAIINALWYLAKFQQRGKSVYQSNALAQFEYALSLSEIAHK